MDRLAIDLWDMEQIELVLVAVHGRPLTGERAVSACAVVHPFDRVEVSQGVGLHDVGGQDGLDRAGDGSYIARFNDVPLVEVLGE